MTWWTAKDAFLELEIISKESKEALGKLNKLKKLFNKKIEFIKIVRKEKQILTRKLFLKKRLMN